MERTFTEPRAHPTEATMPKPAIHAVVGLCVLPFLLPLLGLDLGSPPPPDDAVVVSGIDALYNALAGSFVHTILEWSAFLAALFTVVLAFTHYRVVGDPATPIIGMALFCGGVLDLFHVLAADRLIDAVADPQRLIPFTWALSRLWNALILSLGPLLLLWRPLGGESRRRNTPFVLLICGGFGVFAYALVLACARSTELPRTLYPDVWISRPWDVLPMVLFAVAALVLRRFYRLYPSVFTAALLLSCLPHFATQVAMAFTSTNLFDHGFNTAHLLKVLAYMVPFLGLMLDYVQTQQEARRSREELESRVRERTAELRRAESEAASANRAKSDFLARMSHELRTPLNSILGYAQIFAADSSLGESKRKGIDIIQRSGEHLLALIDDVLDLSKIEARKLEVTPRPFRLPHLLEHVAESEGLRARQRGLTWSYRASPDLPEQVRGDDRRLRQVLLNLLTNAVRYTERGNVAFSADPAPEHGVDRIRFTVRDTGRGIDEADLERIFLPFQQSREASRMGQGTGLGLAITRQLVELMYGHLEVESRVGEGSVFSVVLPLPCCEDADPLNLAESAADWVGSRPRSVPMPPTADQATDPFAGPWPAEPDLRRLLDAARRGAVRELSTTLDGLEPHERLAPFLTRLRRHVDTFDMQSVRTLLEHGLRDHPDGDRDG